MSGIKGVRPATRSGEMEWARGANRRRSDAETLACGQAPCNLGNSLETFPAEHVRDC